MSSKQTASQLHGLPQNQALKTCNDQGTSRSVDYKVTSLSTNRVAKADHSSLRIALLGYRSHPFVGGQGIYLKYLSRALTAIGHRVDVLSGPPYPQLDDNVNLIKIPSLNLYEHDNHVTALRLRHCLSWTDFYEWWAMLTGGFGEPYTFGRRVYKYLKVHGHDYDIVHDNQSLCYGLLRIQKMGLPLITTIHHPITKDRDLALAQAKDKTARWLTKRWYRFLMMQQHVAQQLDHVITVSESSKRDIENDFGRPQVKTQVVPNGVDTLQFHAADRSHVDPWKIITTASSDQVIKGLNYLIDALAIVRQSHPEVTLTVIGKLNSNSNNSELIETHQLKEAIQFVSGISTSELINQYATSAIAVCPSLYEGFGLPVLEAMSCSVPVISTDGGALPEVIGDAGLTVKPADSQALAQAIKKLLDDTQLANHLAKRGRERAKQQFCWNKVALDLSAVYQQCIEQSSDKKKASNSYLNG